VLANIDVLGPFSATNHNPFVAYSVVLIHPDVGSGFNRQRLVLKLYHMVQRHFKNDNNMLNSSVWALSPLHQTDASAHSQKVVWSIRTLAAAACENPIFSSKLPR
jgi:hypothetical protein